MVMRGSKASCKHVQLKNLLQSINKSAVVHTQYIKFFIEQQGRTRYWNIVMCLHLYCAKLNAFIYSQRSMTSLEQQISFQYRVFL